MEGFWTELPGILFGLCMKCLRKVAFAGLICIFALCGSIIGSISGALKGQTTETGLFRGAGIGALAGAVVSLELLESCLQGELLSKVAILGSLLNGKIFREWVSPAVLKAYQWQIDTVEVGDRENFDFFDAVDREIGLLPENIARKLPEFEISSGEIVDSCGEMISCAICLQDFKEGERARRTPICGHYFHALCIDRWLVRHGSCPICRQDACLVHH